MRPGAHISAAGRVIPQLGHDGVIVGRGSQAGLGHGQQLVCQLGELLPRQDA